MCRILCVGEVMVELSQLDDSLFRKSFAGDSFNVGYYISQVSKGEVEAQYLTALSNDGLSDDCVDFISKHGVGTDHIIRLNDATIGLFLLSNDEHGEKQYNYWRGQAAAKRLFDETRDLSEFELIYISGITLAVMNNRENLLSSLIEAQKKGAQIVFDFNYRPKLWSVKEAREWCDRLIGLADILKISDEELETLYPESSLEQLVKQGVGNEWIFTSSAYKAEVWKNNKLVQSLEFEPEAKVVDSSAAGDAFMGTYLVGRYKKFDVARMLKLSHQVARQVVLHKGSIVPINMDELEHV